MNRRHFDYTLLLTTLMLIAIGITMVYSSSAILAREEFSDSYFFLKRQMINLVIGMGALYAGRKIPVQFYKRFAYPILIAAIILLAVVQIPGLGTTVGGATRWFSWGGFSFQPSEFAKIALVFFMAYMLDKKKDKLRSFGVGFLRVVVRVVTVRIVGTKAGQPKQTGSRLGLVCRNGGAGVGVVAITAAAAATDFAGKRLSG